MTTSDHDHHVTDALRGYRCTAIYVGIAIAAVLVLLVYDLINGPFPTPCP